MNIRQVKTEDLSSCFTLEMECFPAEEAASLENIKKRISQFPQGFYVLENEGKIIGHVNSGCTNKDDITDEDFKGLIGHNPTAENMVIFSLAVSPVFRGKKLGHLLLERFIKECQAISKKRILLLCKTDLISYYKNAGFSYISISKSTHGGAQWHEMEFLL